MKKGFLFLAIVLALSATVFGLYGCANNAGTKYAVTFEAGGGSGEAPFMDPQEEGAEFVLPQNTFTFEGNIFSGWETGGTIYEAGDLFTMPGKNVVFTAQWTQEQPSFATPPAFSADSYSYDRLGAGDLELPLALFGANLYYVEVNGNKISAEYFSYEESTSCLVLAEEFILNLSDGAYTIKAITDADETGYAQCTVNIDNSVKTSFDEERIKEFSFGSETGVSFEAQFNGTEVVKLIQGDHEVGKQYYEATDSSFIIKSDWLKRYCGMIEYEIELSNNDRYTFSVMNNNIFYTDYDVTTVHDTTASNTGQNPLYQYYDNVAIVEAPDNSGFEGRVLRFTPNTQDVTYDCHGIYTLRSDAWSSLWYAPGFIQGKYYAVNFDYMTEGTSKGEFYFTSQNTGWKKDLLMGEENDGIKRHFSAVLSMEEIGNGIYLWAFFKDGGGCIYIDNFSVTELDAMPTLVAEQPQYSGGAMELTFDPAGLLWSLQCDGMAVDGVTYDETDKLLRIPETFMQTLSVGSHTFTIETPVGSIQTQIRILDDALAELEDTWAVYNTGRTGDVRLYGSFSSEVQLVSLKQKAKSYNGGFDGWEFVHTDVSENFAHRVNFVAGEDSCGYLELPEKFLDRFWGETVFEAEFSNGGVQEFTIESDIVMQNNLDESTLIGYFNGTADFGGPLNSGLRGNSVVQVEQGPDGDALYIRSTEGAEDSAAFTIRFHQHPWDWYTVPASEGNLYRITFDYAISGLSEKSVYILIMQPQTENKEENFYGSGYEVVNNAVDRYNELRWYLTADGQTHTFDSGWFTYSSELRMSKIVMPAFTAADGSYVMIDNYRITETDFTVSGIPAYTKGSGEYAIDLEGYTLQELKIDGTVAETEVKDGKAVISSSVLEALAPGSHTVILQTNAGVFRAVLQVLTDEIAELEETTKVFAFGDSEVSLAGSFDESVRITSATKQGSHSFDSSFNQAASVDASMFELQTDKLIVKKDLLDVLYGQTKFALELSNGVRLNFTLISDVIYFSNWDDTFVNQPLNSGNAHNSQDDSSLSFEENGIDGTSLKYYVKQATGLGTGPDNKVMLFLTGWSTGMSGYEMICDADHDYSITFDYRIVNEGNGATYSFFVSGPAWSFTSLEIGNADKTEGTFEYSFSGGAENVYAFGIGCNQVGGVENCWLLIDNYRIRAVEKQA